MDKPSLRATMRARRAAYVAGLGVGERATLEAALAKGVCTLLPPGAFLGAYARHGAEIDVANIAPDMALPWFADAMAPCLFRRGPARERGPFGVRQPRASAPIVEPTVILIPLIAFDDRGYRLGQGGGHYDRLLAGLPDRGAVLAVGCAWDVQRVARVPEDAWDMTLDAVVTPSAAFVTARACVAGA